VTLRFGVIGSPVAHSRSPEMHEAAYRALGIDATYERVHVAPDELAGFIGRLAAEGFRGINVTLPHKQAVGAHLDEISKRARIIGAVNSITVEDDGRLVGDNTDAPGLVRSLVEAGFAPRGARVVILGAGGAARAAVVGLAEAGASAITIAARREEAAEALIEDLDAATVPTLARSGMGESLRAVFEDASLLVQATSATLASSPDPTGFAAALPLDALPRDATVVDLVYSPRETTVLAAAASHGLRTVDGLGMLVCQGALSLERWLGQPAPIAAMRDALG